ncbi:MAG TPA: DUF2285 domain-containing protein [Bradyrhizobium sp.]|nr:DUF2285 domain-containing protein [Bradyrhizobium sp.]
MYTSGPLDPDVADLATTDPALARYDEPHLVTYRRMLDANADGADWREVSRIVLGRTKVIARAKWMTGSGYKQLLRRDCEERQQTVTTRSGPKGARLPLPT